MYNPPFQDVNNQPNKLDLEKHWLKYIVHCTYTPTTAYGLLGYKNGCKKVQKLLLSEQKRARYHWSEKKSNAFFADFEVKSNHHFTNKVYWAYF